VADNRSFEVHKECRDFGETNSDARLRTAKRFVEKFVKTVAPFKKFDERDETWTLAVRRRLIEICPKGCYALPDDPYAAKGGYLADFAWLEEGRMKRLLLACQTEWGTGWSGGANWAFVEHGFEKLLAIKAPFKVLIFSSVGKPYGTMEETDFSLEYAKFRLKASLRNYAHHLPGEAYIFVDFPQTRIRNGDGEYQSLIWLAKKFGRQAVKLEPGPKGALIRP
jgi:hypothetical protein